MRPWKTRRFVPVVELLLKSPEQCRNGHVSRVANNVGAVAIGVEACRKFWAAGRRGSASTIFEAEKSVLARSCRPRTHAAVVAGGALADG